MSCTSWSLRGVRPRPYTQASEAGALTTLRACNDQVRAPLAGHGSSPNALFYILLKRCGVTSKDASSMSKMTLRDAEDAEITSELLKINVAGIRMWKAAPSPLPYSHLYARPHTCIGARVCKEARCRKNRDENRTRNRLLREAAALPIRSHARRCAHNRVAVSRKKKVSVHSVLANSLSPSPPSPARPQSSAQPSAALPRLKRPDTQPRACPVLHRWQ